MRAHTSTGSNHVRPCIGPLGLSFMRESLECCTQLVNVPNSPAVNAARSRHPCLFHKHVELTCREIAAAASRRSRIATAASMSRNRTERVILARARRRPECKGDAAPSFLDCFLPAMTYSIWGPMKLAVAVTCGTSTMAHATLSFVVVSFGFDCSIAISYPTHGRVCRQGHLLLIRG